MPILLITVVILIVPIFASIYFYVNKDEKTVKCTIKILGIKIFGVKFTLKNNGIYVEKSFRKPYYINFSLPNIFDVRGGIKKIKKIGILSLNSTLSLGINENEVADYVTVLTLETVQIALFNALKTEKPFLKINNEIKVYENSDAFNIYLRFKTVFNIIDLILILFYNSTEKIRYAISK